MEKDISNDEVEALLRIDKLRVEIDELKKPWWKKLAFQGVLIPLLAALLAIGQDWASKKIELSTLPGKVVNHLSQDINTTLHDTNTALVGGLESGGEIVKYAARYSRGILHSKSGQEALRKAIEQKDISGLEDIVVKISAQTAHKIEKAISITRVRYADKK